MLRSWTENLEAPAGVLQLPGKDVFGRNPPKVASDVLLCENCGQKTAASRFAQHLSKCMGVGGRTASRQASKRASAKMQQFAEEQQSIDLRISSMQQYVIPKVAQQREPGRSSAGGGGGGGGGGYAQARAQPAGASPGGGGGFGAGLVHDERITRLAYSNAASFAEGFDSIHPDGDGDFMDDGDFGHKMPVYSNNDPITSIPSPFLPPTTPNVHI